MKNVVLKNKRYIFGFLLSLEFIFILLSITNQNENYYVLSILNIWLIGVFYGLLDVNKRIFYLGFLLAFFNFLIGRSFLILIGLYKEDYSYKIEDSLNGQKLVLFSILAFVIGYFILENIFFKKKDTALKKYPSIEIVKKISLYLFYLTFIFLLLEVFATIAYVLKNGYASIYINTSSKMNIYFKKIGDICPFMFYIFLSTMPTKKEVKKPLWMFVIYLFSTLGIGARFDFVIGVMVLFIYFFLRNEIGFIKEIWIRKNAYLKLFFLGIIFMMFFSIYNNFRFGFTTSNKNPLKLATKFIYDQGVSVNIPKRIFKYEESIPKDRIYSFDSIISLYKRNIEGRFFGKEYFNGPSAEKALNGNSLADLLSYIMYPDAYLRGNGGGSCYIAEVYHDFSWLGLIIVNLIYAWILLYIRECFNKKYVNFTVAMFLFMALLKTPRARADIFILKLIDPMLWISIFTIMFLSAIFKKRLNIKG